MAEKYSDGSKKVQSSSTSYISSLSDELLVEILCRLGYSKYAVQCKCICKRWFALINTNTNSSADSYFLRRWKHLHHKEGEELAMALLTRYRNSLTRECSVVDYFFQSDKELPTFKPLNFLPNIVDPPCILATFKDLVLCCKSVIDHSVYYVCNPFTRQLTTLPLPNNWYINTSITEVGLIVSNDGKDFKVVRVIPHYPFETDRKSFLVPPHSRKTKAEIFSSDDSNGGWKEMFVPEISSLQFCSYDGMLVWLSQNHNIYGFEFNPNFDAPDNVNSYIRFSLPLGYNQQFQGSPHTRLGVCKGRLRIAQLVRIAPLNVGQNVDYGLKLLIWELNSPSRSSWELVHKLNFSEMKDCSGSRLARSCYKKGLGLRSTILLHPHDGDILYLVLHLPPNNAVDNKVHSYLFSCNARRRTLKVIRKISGMPPSCIAFTLLQPSWPTSVPLLTQFE